MRFKRSAALLLAMLCALGLFGCAVTEESGYDYVLSALEKADKVTVHLYGDEEASLVVPATEELSALIKGEWNAAAGQDKGQKLLTVTVGTQHEITFFDNGRAMIYYGYASVIEKDRCYYEVKLENSVSDIEKYAQKHGIDADCAMILELFCREEDSENNVKALDIRAALYGEETTVVDLSSDADLDALLAGSWRQAPRRDAGKLLMALTVDSKYVLEIYEDSLARISEINSLGEEKSSTYYDVALDLGADSLYNYCMENGKVSKAD